VPDPHRDHRESFSDYYDRPVNNALFRWIDLRKIGIIRTNFADLPRGALLLDLGCGSGRIISKVARPGDTALAADIDLTLLSKAHNRGSQPLCVDFDTPLPLADGVVDGAMIIDALEHTEHPRSILDELHRVLRAGGILVVFTPPYDSHTWIAAEKAHNFVTRRRSDHISPFTRESLTYAVGRRFTSFKVGRTNFGLSMYAVAVK
jgi:SAM-dependent methyltransferase